MSSVSVVNVMNLCRVCSVPASHSIFKTIPPYLHENVKETVRWREPIYKMIQDIIGLNVCMDFLYVFLLLLFLFYL